MSMTFDMVQSEIGTDLRLLDPVAGRTTGKKSDWRLSRLLEHNGYTLVAAEIVGNIDYSGYYKEDDFFGTWCEFDVISMPLDILYMRNSDMKLFRNGILAWARPDFVKDREWLDSHCIGENDGWWVCGVDDAVIRFTRNRDGVLNEPRWVGIEYEGEEYVPSGVKIDYRSNGIGRLEMIHTEALYRLYCYGAGVATGKDPNDVCY